MTRSVHHNGKRAGPQLPEAARDSETNRVALSRVRRRLAKDHLGDDCAAGGGGDDHQVRRRRGAADVDDEIVGEESVLDVGDNLAGHAQRRRQLTKRYGRLVGEHGQGRVLRRRETAAPEADPSVIEPFCVTGRPNV